MGEATSFVFILFAIFPTAIWIYSIVDWMLMGEMDTALGMVGIFVGLGVGVVAAVPPVPVLAPIALAVLYMTLIVFPLAKRQLERQQLVKIDVERIEKAYAMIAQKPNNAMLKFKLAEAVYTRGLAGHAIRIAEESLQGAPKDAFRDEHRALEKWRRMARDPALFRPIPCLKCGHSNQPGMIHCGNCGEPYLADYARGKWLGKTLAMRLVASWVSAAVSLVGIPVVISLPIDIIAIVVLVVLQIVVAGVLVWVAFFKKEEERAT